MKIEIQVIGICAKPCNNKRLHNEREQIENGGKIVSSCGKMRKSQ